jgi:hypothetical protein
MEWNQLLEMFAVFKLDVRITTSYRIVSLLPFTVRLLPVGQPPFTRNSSGNYWRDAHQPRLSHVTGQSVPPVRSETSCKAGPPACAAIEVPPLVPKKPPTTARPALGGTCGPGTARLMRRAKRKFTSFTSPSFWYWSALVIHLRNGNEMTVA